MKVLSSLRPRLTVLQTVDFAPVSIPLTTVSLEGNFDAYIDVQFPKDGGSLVTSLLVDSGNCTMIVPHGEDLVGLSGYTVLGTATEPWGCPANIVQGPVQILASDGSIYQIEACVFYACTANNPQGERTANFGTGRIVPWPANGWNTPNGISMAIQSPLSYNTSYPFAEFVYAPAETMFSNADVPHLSDASRLILHATRPSSFTMLETIPNLGWMSVVPASLTIGGAATGWPRNVAAPIAMVDTGGGPVLLSDPNGDVWNKPWPDPLRCPSWTTIDPPESRNCLCVSEPLILGLVGSDGRTRYTYTIDTRSMPASVQGLTAVMCELNGYMMGEQGMNIGGISALFNRILVNYAGSQVGLAPK